MKIFLLVISVFVGCFTLHAQVNNATLSGTITDGGGRPLELANVSIKGSTIGTVSARDGRYLLRIPPNKTVVVVFSMVGYQTIEKNIRANGGQRLTMSISLMQVDQELDEVKVTQSRQTKANMERIDARHASHLIDVGTGGVEALVKTLPGVSSNNELSSQYSVRGGNFDENLVYVNDVEVYRPLLTKSGQQEGMSSINSDLVSSIEFSAGGFDAKYGDKMSSVLDIRYRRPTKYSGSATASFLGGSVHFEGLSKNSKFLHITGLRYKTNRYLLGTLDEKGEYNPRFSDLQTYLTYKFSPAFDLSFMGNLAQNHYNFVPQTRETSFGTINQVYQAKIYFEGQEADQYKTTTGALIGNYHPTEKLNMKFIVSAFKSNEAETYDILGQYYLGELEQMEEAKNDSVLHTGVGTFLNHARNYLDVSVYSLEHKGAFNSGEHLFNWGLKAQHERIDDRMSEWVLRDSTGYSIPYHGDKIELYSSLNMKHVMSSFRASAFIQDTYQIPVSKGSLYATAGLRAHYWSYSNELLLNPRATLRYYPEWGNNFVFRLSGGLYSQPAFYKEFKGRDGTIYAEAKAQRSAQAVFGTDYVFSAWGRPFKFTSELYYKYMPELTPYQIDNVRIRYLPDQRSKGYAVGADMKINGEFVKGAESWASLSIMKTAEDIHDDGHGYIPRPTDQRFNFSIYFQDYIPGNPSWKMHLTAFYGSRLPTGPPNAKRYMDVFRMPPYRRIDLGISKVLIGDGTNQFRNKALSQIEDMWLSLEVFNLLGINNTISYLWVANNRSEMFGVPNYLTKRKVNIKLTVRF